MTRFCLHFRSADEEPFDESFSGERRLLQRLNVTSRVTSRQQLDVASFRQRVKLIRFRRRNGYRSQEKYLETASFTDCCKPILTKLRNFYLKRRFLLRPGRGTNYCDQLVCLPVCLSVCPRAYLWNCCGPTKFYTPKSPMPCGRGSVLL